MLKLIFVLGGLLDTHVALACDLEEDPDEAAADVAESDEPAPDEETANPVACAKKVELIGDNCSYTTHMMAARVLAEGHPWTFTGRLKPADNDLASHVAAPFTLGPEDEVHVVANEVLEEMTSAAFHVERVVLEGKRLLVDETTYFVLTRYCPPAI